MSRSDSRVPVYQELSEELRRRIESGELRPGDCIRSENELSSQYGISRPSVRKAVSALIKDGLVVKVPGKGTFVANPDESKPRESADRVISFVVPDVQTPFIGEVYRGMRKVAEKHGYVVAVYSSDWEIEKENRNILLTMERGECGTIIFPNWGRNNYTEIMNLKRAGFPFVLIDCYFKDLPTDYVVVDSFMGAYEAVEHLIKLGHTSIAHIAGMPCTGNDARLEGYKQALLDHGLPFAEDNVRSIARPEYAYAEPHQFCGQEETSELMKRRNRPTAIFAGSDFIGMGALQGAKSCGLSVPEDVAVVSFDDLEWAAWPDIQLTTVAQPKEEIGAKAAELLIGKIEARRKVSRRVGIQQIVLTPRLIVRRTCGAGSSSKITL